MMKVEQRDPASSSREMNVNLTERARRDLEQYLERVREILWERTDVDAEDVVRGIREHVEATLAHGDQGPMTAEDLADVLDRLGSPEEWVTEGVGSDPEPKGGPPAPASDLSRPSANRPWTELAPLVLAGAGGILVLIEVTVPLGWGLLAVAALTARLVLASATHQARGNKISGTLVEILWHVSASVAVVGTLLLPAVLVWAQSQIGGALEPFLLERTLPPGASASTGSGPRPRGYWPLVALLAGSGTGAWWVALGAVGRVYRKSLRRALRPADYLVSRHVVTVLLLTGGFLAVLSLALLVGALG